MSKPRTRPGLAVGERPAALVPLHSGRIAEYGVLAAPLVALGVALPLFVPFVCHRPSPSQFRCPLMLIEQRKGVGVPEWDGRWEENRSEFQYLMRTPYAVFGLKKKKSRSRRQIHACNLTN